MRTVRVIMIFLQLLLSNSLIFLIEAYPNDKELGIYNITPIFYEILLKPDVEANIFRGHCQILIRVEEKKQTISFHSAVAKIENTTLRKIEPMNETLVSLDRTGQYRRYNATYKPKSYRFDSDLGIYSLDFDKAIEYGYYVLEIHYFGYFTDDLEKDGFLRTSIYDFDIKDNRWMIATRTHKTGPQAIFPCWNNPRFKTVFNVSIRHPMDYMAVSNSKLEMLEQYGDDVMILPPFTSLTWSTFKSTPPISPYCIAIVVMPKYKAYNRDQNVTMWADKSKSESLFDIAIKITMRITKYLKEQNIEDQCKVAETNYIAAFGFPENKAITTHAFAVYSLDNISFIDKISSVARKLNIARFLAQHLAHQWILRTTHTSYWSSSWLYGASKFLSVYLLDKVLPQFEVITWSIDTAYKQIPLNFQFNSNNIMVDIFTSKSNIATLCDSRNYNETELTLKFLNKSVCTSL